MMTVKEIRDAVSSETVILIHDELSEEGTVYEGPELQMRTTWDKRTVTFIRPYDQKLYLNVV